MTKDLRVPCSYRFHKETVKTLDDAAKLSPFSKTKIVETAIKQFISSPLQKM